MHHLIYVDIGAVQVLQPGSDLLRPMRIDTGKCGDDDVMNRRLKWLATLQHRRVSFQHERVKGVPTELVAFKDGKYVWTWVTNIDYSQLCRYRGLYRKRWNIETGFRVQDEAMIKTKSLSIAVRLFLFLATLLWYNAWKALGEADVRVSFKRFVISGVAGMEYWAAIGIP